MTGALLLAACGGDHLTLGDALGIFGMLVGLAAIFWALTR